MYDSFYLNYTTDVKFCVLFIASLEIIVSHDYNLLVSTYIESKYFAFCKGMFSDVRIMVCYVASIVFHIVLGLESLNWVSQFLECARRSDLKRDA